MNLSVLFTHGISIISCSPIQLKRKLFPFCKNNTRINIK